MSASQQLLQAVQAPVDDLPVIDWDAALDAMSCAGPEDLPFVVELLVTFYTDSLPHLERILAAAMAFREGKLDAFLWTEGAKPDPAPRSVVRVLKEEAHAVKGSAANLRLYRIAKIAERVEMTPKKLMLDAGVGITGDAGAALLSAEALATLRGMCCMPAHDLCRLVQEFEALVAFVEGGELDAKLREGGTSLAEAAEAAGSTEVTESLHAMTAAAFHQRIRVRFHDFWRDSGSGGSNASSSRAAGAAGGAGNASSSSAAPAVAWAGPSTAEAAADLPAPGVLSSSATRTPAGSGAMTLSRPDTADATAVDTSSAGGMGGRGGSVAAAAAASAGLAAAVASAAEKGGQPELLPVAAAVSGQPTQPQSQPQPQTTLSHSSASVAPLPSGGSSAAAASAQQPQQQQKAAVPAAGAQPNPTAASAHVAAAAPPVATAPEAPQS